MVEAKETLRKLSEKASKLNKSSDEINGIISAFENKLAEMNLGIEVWYGDTDKDWFCNPNAHHHGFTLAKDDDEDDNGDRVSFIVVLGYCKIGSSWRLAVKEGNIRCTQVGEDFIETFTEVKRYPLSEASRADRMNALGAMEWLFQAIENKADELLAKIEKGRQFVKSIE